jgi:hypothetical protein
MAPAAEGSAPAPSPRTAPARGNGASRTRWGGGSGSNLRPVRPPGSHGTSDTPGLMACLDGLFQTTTPWVWNDTQPLTPPAGLRGMVGRGAITQPGSPGSPARLRNAFACALKWLPAPQRPADSQKQRRIRPLASEGISPGDSRAGDGGMNTACTARARSTSGFPAEGCATPSPDPHVRGLIHRTFPRYEARRRWEKLRVSRTAWTGHWRDGDRAARQPRGACNDPAAPVYRT